MGLRAHEGRLGLSKPKHAEWQPCGFYRHCTETRQWLNKPPSQTHAFMPSWRTHVNLRSGNAPAPRAVQARSQVWSLGAGQNPCSLVNSSVRSRFGAPKPGLSLVTVLSASSLPILVSYTGYSPHRPTPSTNMFRMPQVPSLG